MRKFLKFLFYFLLISLGLIIFFFLTNFRAEKDLFLLSIKIIENFIFTIPVVASLSLLWGLIIKTKKDSQTPVSPAAMTFSIFIYIFIILGTAFFFQELVLPKLYLRKTDFFKLDFIKDKKKKVEKLSTAFTAQDELSLRKLPYKENISFMMGDVFVSFKKLYKGNTYYVEDLILVGYSKKSSVDYIVSARYGKFVDGIIYPVSTTFVDFSGAAKKAFSVHPSKGIPITYDPEAIYIFASDEDIEKVSLIDVFRFSDFLFSSKIHYQKLGNIIYNQLVYYIITFFLLFLCSLLGTKYPVNRPIYKEYFEFISFLIVSVSCLIISYDIMVAFARMIYELLI
ncbi:MAG: hypothetical protein ACP5QT_07975 [Brevinematia bacterium]